LSKNREFFLKDKNRFECSAGTTIRICLHLFYFIIGIRNAAALRRAWLIATRGIESVQYPASTIRNERCQ